MNNYELEDPPLVNEEQALQKLSREWINKPESLHLSKTLPLQTIKTGIYIQSLQFLNLTDINLSGYIWQHYNCDMVMVEEKVIAITQANQCKNIALRIPEQGDVGFILPEQVNFDADIEPKEVYRKLSSDARSLVIGWYFKASLRQPSEYHTYPFDHKTVSVRLWPQEFSENIVLIPDYASYDSTGIADTFGIDQSIVMEAWQPEDTYFDYLFTPYDLSFGIEKDIGKQNFPQMRYNFVVKRKFGHAFIVFLLPLFLVASLLFAAMLTVSNEEKKSDQIRFNLAGFIGASSALFFVVILLHIKLRGQFAGSSIVYIEYLYVLMYAVLIITTTNTYLFSTHSTVLNGLLLKEDNVYPKVLYWPMLLASIIGITVWVM